jgi:hypothetical protein
MSVPESTLASPDRARLFNYGKALLSNCALMVVNAGEYLVAVPWYVHWLGAERFGTWLVLLQVLHGIARNDVDCCDPLTRSGGV